MESAELLQGFEWAWGIMFVKGKKIEKSAEKGEKDVDIREGGVVLYSSARKTGPRERVRRARES